MILGKAAITNGHGIFTIEDIEVGDPEEHEVLVEIKASGICHTDWDSLKWGKPLILGHEGAGVILKVGAAVDHVKEGDIVLLNWAISCGKCFQCRTGNLAICENNSPAAARKPLKGHAHLQGTLHQRNGIERSFNIGTLSSHTLVRKEAVVKIERDIPFASAAILGCGVMTGYGSVVNAAKVSEGSSVVVIGCGGVGLNVIQGAKIAKADTIIAIDVKEHKLDMAKKFGATHVIKPYDHDKELLQVEPIIRKLTNRRGADYAFECTGVPALGAAPLRFVRNAGTAVQVSGIEEELTIDMNLFEWDKLYINPLYGKCNPKRDFPKLLELYREGDLLLDELVSKTYPLGDLGIAFSDMLTGRIAKGVIAMGDGA